MRTTRPLAAALAAWLLASAAGAGTGQVVLEPVRDNTLIESGSVALSNGQGDFFVAGRTRGTTGTTIRRGLLDFDVAAGLPAGSTITGVALRLHMRKTTAGAQPVDLHRALADWGEGASVAFGGGGAASQPGDATWTDRFHPGQPWSSNGGDYAAGASASTVVAGVGLYLWSSPQLALDVQDMLDDPANDHGWVLLGNESASRTTKLFTSREFPTAGFRPALRIDYVTPDPVVYCTPGTSSSGCRAMISASGTPSASAQAGFILAAAGGEGAKDGMFFYGTSGRLASSWGSGTSYICIQSPTRRGGLTAGIGTTGACDGSFLQDLNARWCPACPKPNHNPGAGAVLQAQLWYRDPQNTSNQSTSLSNAVEVVVCP